MAAKQQKAAYGQLKCFLSIQTIPDYTSKLCSQDQWKNTLSRLQTLNHYITTTSLDPAYASFSPQPLLLFMLRPRKILLWRARQRLNSGDMASTLGEVTIPQHTCTCQWLSEPAARMSYKNKERQEVLSCSEQLIDPPNEKSYLQSNARANNCLVQGLTTGLGDPCLLKSN